MNDPEGLIELRLSRLNNENDVFGVYRSIIVRGATTPLNPKP